MATAKQIASNLRKDIEKLQNNIGEFLTKNIEKKARKNFDKFVPQASTDYPFVDVYSSFSGGKTMAHGEVVCGGYQVLFIEFGVGSNNAQGIAPEWTSTSYTINEAGNYDLRIRHGGGYDVAKTGFKFVDNRLTEIMPRPQGIFGLGGYGKHHGADDYWVRPSIDGVPKTDGEWQVTARNGQPRTNAVFTTGHQPARALYRAMRSSMKSLERMLGGKR